MIVVRNVFQLKFGQAKPAMAAFKEGRAFMKKLGLTAETRLLTDVTGPSYTLVHELTFENLAAWESEGRKVMGSPEWRAWYDTFTPYVEAGSREIMSVVEG